MAEINRHSLKISQLTLVEEGPYLDFLQKAYKGQFNSYRFVSRQEIKDFWRWEQIINPFKLSENPLVWICRSYEEIVGQICFMPVSVVIKGKSYTGGWFQDFILLPDFRDKGIGQRLLQEAKNGLAETIDIAMAVIGTERSKAIFSKLGLLEIGELKKNIAVRLASKALFSFLPRVAQDIEIREIDASGDDFEALWKRLSSKFTCLIKRDKYALSWRFMPQPYWSYRLFLASKGNVPKGYVVVKTNKYDRNWKVSNEGVISDLFFDPLEMNIGYALLEKALSVMKGEVFVRCDVMSLPIHEFLRNVGFFCIKSNNSIYMSFSQRVDREDVALASNKNNWHITYGDTDLDFN